jgi:hypothetical protein
MMCPVEGVGWVSVPQHDCVSCRDCNNLEPCKQRPGARLGGYIDSLLVVLVSSTGDSMQYELSCICRKH